jgi:hypothetical protein
MVIVTLCLFAIVGLGLGMTARWPLLAIIATFSLIGSILLLGLAGESLAIAAGKATAIVVILEAGFLIGSVTVDHRLREGVSPHSAPPRAEAWSGENLPSRANAVFRSPLPGLPPDDSRL